MAKASFHTPKLECKTFDTRVQKRHIAQGRISVSDIAKHLKGLPDDADNAETVTVYLGEEPPEDAEEAEAAEAEVSE